MTRGSGATRGPSDSVAADHADLCNRRSRTDIHSQDASTAWGRKMTAPRTPIRHTTIRSVPLVAGGLAATVAGIAMAAALRSDADATVWLYNDSVVVPIGDTDVGLCPDGGSYEIHLFDIGNDHTADAEHPVFEGATAQAAIDEFIASIRSAATRANPALLSLDPEYRRMHEQWIDTFYAPARTLTLHADAVRGTTGYFIAPADGTVEPGGPDRWAWAVAQTAEIPGGGFAVIEAAICTDALVTRQGQHTVADTYATIRANAESAGG